MKFLPWPIRAVGAALGLLVGIAGRAPAQIDYRNLDADRPIAVEDAYPVERWAFELVMPWRYARERGEGSRHLMALEEHASRSAVVHAVGDADDHRGRPRLREAAPPSRHHLR